MYAIDREALADALTFGTSKPTRRLFAASSPLHRPRCMSPRLTASTNSTPAGREACWPKLAVAISDQAALVPIMTRSNVYAYRTGCVTNLTP